LSSAHSLELACGVLSRFCKIGVGGIVRAMAPLTAWVIFFWPVYWD